MFKKKDRLRRRGQISAGESLLFLIPSRHLPVKARVRPDSLQVLRTVDSHLFFRVLPQKPRNYLEVPHKNTGRPCLLRPVTHRESLSVF